MHIHTLNCRLLNSEKVSSSQEPGGDISTSSIERPRRELNDSLPSLFNTTPNNDAVFEFTHSEDDELWKGLPRFGKKPVIKEEKVKTVDLDEEEVRMNENNNKK